MREQELIAFGSKLKKIRQEKKLEIKKISEQTKININYLKNIEEGQFDFLPRLYVRSFLKLYIQQLGEDWASFLHEYDAIKSEAIAPEVTEPETAKAAAIPPATIKTEAIKSEKKLKVTVVTDEDLKAIKKPGHLRQQITTVIEKIKPYLRQMNIIWLGLGAIILFLFIYSLLKPKNDQPIISAGTTVTALIEPQPSVQDTLVTPQPVNQSLDKRDDLSLELKALETTWLQIIVDDSVAKELTFDSGTTQRWRAKEKFKLRIGNAGGVRLVLNGQDLGKLGRVGEVIKFDLTEAGIQKSSL